MFLSLWQLAWDKAGYVQFANVYQELQIQLDAIDLSGPGAEVR